MEPQEEITEALEALEEMSFKSVINYESCLVDKSRQLSPRPTSHYL
jgi:hypothetical protein